MPSRGLLSGRIATTPGTPNGLPETPAYQWRGHVTPQQRAELEAHDAKFADRAPAPAHGGSRDHAGRARARWRREEYTRLRAQGASVEAAATAVGWEPKTGQRYERKRDREAAQ